MGTFSPPGRTRNLRLRQFQNGMFNATEIGKNWKKWKNPSTQITVEHKLIPTRYQVAFWVAFLGLKVELKIHNRESAWIRGVSFLVRTRLSRRCLTWSRPLFSPDCELKRFYDFLRITRQNYFLVRIFYIFRLLFSPDFRWPMKLPQKSSHRKSGLKSIFKIYKNPD